MKKLVFLLGIALAIFISADIAWATQTINDVLEVNSLRVGKQGVGGVTYFNGTIVNETEDNYGNDIPVTYGDNVRIDGVVWRGATQGGFDTSGDVHAFSVNDDLTVNGDAIFSGDIRLQGGDDLDTVINGLIIDHNNLDEAYNNTVEVVDAHSADLSGVIEFLGCIERLSGEVIEYDDWSFCRDLWL